MNNEVMQKEALFKVQKLRRSDWKLKSQMVSV
jgi:hypothetical protein